MGLFASRPEEDPTDWTGLPSEPLEPESAAERPGTSSVDPAGLGLILPDAASIPIELPSTPEADRAD